MRDVVTVEEVARLTMLRAMRASGGILCFGEALSRAGKEFLDLLRSRCIERRRPRWFQWERKVDCDGLISMSYEVTEAWDVEFRSFGRG
jgi:hypothetical protein